MPTAARSSFTIPRQIFCRSGTNTTSGHYAVVEGVSRGSESKLPQLIAAGATERGVLYQKSSNPCIYLVYCEGTPELLPGDIWETVLAESLAANAEANMSAAVSETPAGEVSGAVCSYIMKVAMEVSRELAGWIVLVQNTDCLVPLARCIQRVPENCSVPMQSVFLTEPNWEVHSPTVNESGPPEWLKAGLPSAWRSLVFQTGQFQPAGIFKIETCMPESSNSICEISPNNFEWVFDIAATTGEMMRSPSFWRGNEEYSLGLHSQCDDRFTSIVMSIHGGLAQPGFKYRIHVGDKTCSGVKIMTPPTATVLFDARLFSQTLASSATWRSIRVEFL